MCHVIPVANAIAVKFWHMKTNDPRIGQLKIMFYGASIFGVVDHLWNGEFFMLSPNLAKDLMLGVAITLCVWGIWGAGLLVEKFSRQRKVVVVKA